MQKARWIITVLAALCLLIVAQADDIYTDGAGRYQINVPEGWQNLSTPEQAHFINEEGTADIYALVVEVDDLQAGIQSGLERLFEGFSATAMQSSEATLPNGATWTQNVYMLPAEGVLIAALARVEEGSAYVIVVRAPQSVLVGSSAVINDVVFSHTLANQESVVGRLPEYANTDAYTEQEVIIISGTYELPATLTLPVVQTGDTFPAVVIVHGSGPNDRDGSIGVNKAYRDLAVGLSSQGIAVLRYDKRTFVYREMTPGFTIDDEVTDDALAALNFLREFEGVDAERLYVIGHSQGAMFAPRIAERAPELAGIVMIAGTPNPFDSVIRSQIEYLRGVNPDTNLAGIEELADILDAIRAGESALSAFGGDETQVAYWEGMLAYVPGDTALTLDLPMLILHGERDYQVTMADFAAWSDLLGERDNVTLISYPTLNHLLMALGDPDRLAIPEDYALAGFVDIEVIDDIAVWIND